MSGFQDFEMYDGIGLAELVARNETSPAELLEAAIDRAERVSSTINAINRPMYDEAWAAVKAGLPDGPFKGVPYLLKDLGALYAGVPTGCGSKLFSNFVPDHDSELVARYKRAGLVIFGKTNTPELGNSCATEPRQFGATCNPWDTSRIPGGSSGGSAAAVSAGIVPFAHATDGGGSIRIPASCCGLFGLKPNRARNPFGPDFGEGHSGYIVHHAVTRSVRDSAALLDASSGPDVGDPYCAPPPARSYLAEVHTPPGKLRIAVQTLTDSGALVHPECVKAVRDTAALCTDLGHTVEEDAPAYDVEALGAATRVIEIANLMLDLTDRSKTLGHEPNPDDVERFTWEFARLGRALGADDYARALCTVHTTGRAVARFFLTYDVLLTPTLATPPVEIGTFDMSTADADGYWRQIFEFAAFTLLENATGQPAMTVPLHWTGDGLPVGSHFVGRFGDEATLFRLAAQLEEARPWFNRRPPPILEIETTESV